MLFYRVAIKCKTKEPAEGDISIFGYKSATYYEEKSQSGFVFLIRLSLKNGDAVLCAALEKSVNKEKQITDYLSYVGLEFSKLEFREITISYFQALLELGERNNLVLDRDNLLYKLKIEGSGKYFDNYVFVNLKLVQGTQKSNRKMVHSLNEISRMRYTHSGGKKECLI